MTTKFGLLKRSAVHWKPHDYMLKAVKFLLSHGAAGLFLDPGLGKTSIVLKALSILLTKGISSGALIIAPLRVCYMVWPAEGEKWIEFNGLKIVVLHGKDKLANLNSAADIYVINPEGLEWLVTEGRLSDLVARGVDTLVVDELSKFKHTNTRRFKMIKPYLKLFRRRWGLTGTPASNGLLDLFGQCFILDMGGALGSYITHYRISYFYQSGYGGYTWSPMPGSEERIYEKLRPLVLRMEDSDYLKLPEIIPNIIRVELPPKARQIYDSMEEHALAQLDELKTVTAQSAAAAMIKCSQVANGGIYLDPVYVEWDPTQPPPPPAKREWQHIHDAKTEALIELVEELQGKPILVAYAFQHDLERLLKAFPKAPWIGGGVSPKKAAQIEQDWNAGLIHGPLFGHPASIGHGLNFQGQDVQDVCWYGNTFDLELHEQFNRRVRRQGNNASHVRIHYLVGRDTVDEAMLGAIRKKTKVQGALLEALKSYRKGDRV